MQLHETPSIHAVTWQTYSCNRLCGIICNSRTNGLKIALARELSDFRI